MRGELLPDIFDKVNKVFRVAVGHVYADILQLRHRRQYGGNPVEVSFTGPCADCYTLEDKQSRERELCYNIYTVYIPLLINTNEVPQ